MLTHFFIRSLFITVFCTQAGWSATTSNLVINGNAESADLTGWSSTSGLQVGSTTVSGTNGLPNPNSIGDFIFYGGEGDATARATQTISLTDYLADINTGTQPFYAGALLQSRVLFNGRLIISDIARIEFSFRDLGGMVLGSPIIFVDNAPVSNRTQTFYDWDEFSETGFIPSGSRELVIEMTSSRTGVSSTDSYIDNIEFRLTPIPEPSTALLSTAATTALLGLRRQRIQ